MNRWQPGYPILAVVCWACLLGAGVPGDDAGQLLAHHTPADASGGRRAITYSGRSMGTYVRVVIVSPDSMKTAPAARSAHAAFARVDSLMSNWTATSEVARLNREAASARTPVHPEVATVLEAALQAWRESDGAFDVTIEPLVRLWGFIGGKPHVPAEEDQKAAFRLVGGDKLHFDPDRRTLKFEKPGVKIDLGGIAKGYAVDQALESLRRNGVTDALVDISGNMYALGGPAHSRSWRIGIRDPRDRISYFARLPLTGQGISTSGKYEQFVAANGKTYGHIMDPRTGSPAEGLISVTVVAPDAMTADAWSTALFVLGPAEAMRKARERDDIAVILVQPSDDGVDKVWVENTLKGIFTMEAAAKEMFKVEFF